MTRYIAYTQSGQSFDVPASWCGGPVTDADDALNVARAVHFDRAVDRLFNEAGLTTSMSHDYAPAASASVRNNPVIRVEARNEA